MHCTGICSYSQTYTLTCTGRHANTHTHHTTCTHTHCTEMYSYLHIYLHAQADMHTYTHTHCTEMYSYSQIIHLHAKADM